MRNPIIELKQNQRELLRIGKSILLNCAKKDKIAADILDTFKIKDLKPVSKGLRSNANAIETVVKGL